MIMSDNYVEWLSDLKVGDDVVITHSSFSDSLMIRQITRMTKTTIVCGDYRFRRIDGFTPGGGYCRSHISKPTPELHATIRKAKLRRAITHIVGDSSVSLDALNAMYNAYLNSHGNTSAGSSIG